MPGKIENTVVGLWLWELICVSGVEPGSYTGIPCAIHIDSCEILQRGCFLLHPLNLQPT